MWSNEILAGEIFSINTPYLKIYASKLKLIPMSYLKSISLLSLMMLGIIYGCNRSITSSQNESDSAQAEHSESEKTETAKTEPSDTVYSDGWLMVDNPHPKVKSVWFSKPNDRRDPYQFRIHYNEEANLSEQEALLITKLLIGFNNKYDSLAEWDGKSGEYHGDRYRIYHKGIKIETAQISTILSEDRIIKTEGTYPRGLDIDVENIISADKAIEIVLKNNPSKTYEWLKEKPGKPVRWVKYLDENCYPVPGLEIKQFTDMGKFLYVYIIPLVVSDIPSGIRYVDAVNGKMLDVVDGPTRFDVVCNGHCKMCDTSAGFIIDSPASASVK